MTCLTYPAALSVDALETAGILYFLILILSLFPNAHLVSVSEKIDLLLGQKVRLGGGGGGDGGG